MAVYVNKGFRLTAYTDDRTSEEVAAQHEAVDAISQANLRKFGVVHSARNPHTLDDKVVHVQQRLDLGEGWFVTYTDNLHNNASFSYPFPVITVHGCPGNQREWARWEKNMVPNFARWINVVVPGFDDIDERRGDYSGSIYDISRLLDRLMERLGFGQVVLLGHSMGSYISNAFSSLYPHRLAGQGLIAAATPDWNVGMKAFHSALVESLVDDFADVGRTLQLVNTDADFRRRFHARYEQSYRNLYVVLEPIGRVQMPKMSESGAIASFKLFGTSFLHTDLEPKNWSQSMVHFNRNMPAHKLRFMIAPKKDIIMEISQHTKMLYLYLGKRKSPQLTPPQQARLRELLSAHPVLSSVEWDLDNVQNNFTLLFEDTGHTVHTRRGQELAHPFRLYLLFLLEFQKVQPSAKL